MVRTLPLLLLLTACNRGGHTGPVLPEEEPALTRIPLVEGKTTREEVLIAFGLPSAQFEGDRILCYRLMPTKDGLVVVPRELDANDWRFTTWRQGEEYNLVAVFDARNVLARHSLLRIR